MLVCFLFGSTQYKLLYGQYGTGVTPKQQLFGFIRVNVAKLWGENGTKFIVKTLLVFSVKYGAKLQALSLFCHISSKLGVEVDSRIQIVCDH